MEECCSDGAHDYGALEVHVPTMTLVDIRTPVAVRRPGLYLATCAYCRVERRRTAVNDAWSNITHTVLKATDPVCDAALFLLAALSSPEGNFLAVRPAFRRSTTTILLQSIGHVH